MLKNTQQIMSIILLIGTLSLGCKKEEIAPLNLSQDVKNNISSNGDEGADMKKKLTSRHKTPRMDLRARLSTLPYKIEKTPNSSGLAVSRDPITFQRKPELGINPDNSTKFPYRIGRNYEYSSANKQKIDKEEFQWRIYQQRRAIHDREQKPLIKEIDRMEKVIDNQFSQLNQLVQQKMNGKSTDFTRTINILELSSSTVQENDNNTNEY